MPELATALLSATALPDAATAPDWIMLMPAGRVGTVDGRGPYEVDAAKIAAASLAASGGRLPIDENHATDLSAPRGGPSPARGWVVELEARGDGLWGRVEWTAEGRRLVEGRAYRHISPVITHDAKGHVGRLLRAALTNAPNMRGMVALNQEIFMDLMMKLRKALGLADDAGEDAIIAAVDKLRGGTATQAAIGQVATAIGLGADATPEAIIAGAARLRADAGTAALQAALGPIAEAAGLERTSTAAEVRQAVETLAGKAGAGTKAIASLQAELSSVTSGLETLKEATARDRATAFVEGSIRAGKVGVKPLRDHYITRHMADPEGVEKEIAAFAILGPGQRIEVVPPAGRDGEVSLNAAQREAARLTGEDPAKIAETVKAERAEREQESFA